MAAGLKRLQRIQFAKETTPGTAATATTRWRGMGGMLDDQRTVEEIDELVGVFEGADRTQVTKLLGMLTLAATPLTFEQFQYLLAMSFGGPTTGSADGSGSDKIYQTNMPTTAAVTPVPYTVEGGDDYEQEVMEYCVATKVHIAGVMGATVKMDAALMGRQVQRLSAGFSAGGTIPTTLEAALTNNAKVYLDAVSGAYGTTQVSSAIAGFDISFEPVWTPVFTTDGNLYYSYPRFAGYKCTGALTFLNDSALSGSGGAKADFRNQTAKLLRISIPGSAVVTPGTTYSTKMINIDLPIKYQPSGPLTDQNGIDVLGMKFRSRYNVTAGNAGKIVVVNEQASLA